MSGARVRPGPVAAPRWDGSSRRGPAPKWTAPDPYADPSDPYAETSPSSRAPLVGAAAGAGLGLLVLGPLGLVVGGLVGWAGGRRLAT